jgi:hypothetical protein
MGFLFKKDKGFDPPPPANFTDPVDWLDEPTEEDDANAALRAINPLDAEALAKATAGRYEEELPEAEEAEEAEEPRYLQKAGGGRRAYLRKWIASRLAIGQTVEELAEYAMRHDPETAYLITEVGSKLEK